MPNRDDDDWDPVEQDWADDEDANPDDDPDNDNAAPCPECGRPVETVAEMCPACGYWLTDDDRRQMWSSMRRPRWLTITAWVVLAAFVIPVIALVVVVLRRRP
jgi:ribosomal protein L37E